MSAAPEVAPAHAGARRERPRVVLLADRPGWAFDFIARALIERLSQRFRFELIYREREPLRLRREDIDLLYVFWWGDRSYQHLGLPPERIVVEVASHRWEVEERFGRLSPDAFAAEYLADCARVTTPSLRLFETLRAVRSGVFHCPNGVDLARFHPGRPRRGPLRIGWVGNPGDATKGLSDILLPATEASHVFEHTDGRRSPRQVARLYRRCDVLAVASLAESQPLPLLEAMASGCFPVTTDVGVAPELIRSGCNGLVVERGVDDFREAFAWCARNLPRVRRAGAFNARLMADERSWDLCAERFGDLFDAALGSGPEIAERAPETPSAARAALERGTLSVRAAFVTPELADARSTGGGLGSYVDRMARALALAGHEVEVLTTAADAATPSPHRGVRVHALRRAIDFPIARAVLRVFECLRLQRLALPLLSLLDAARLARALRRREARVGFDFVQSADHLASGLFVPRRGRRRPRPHLVRVSNDGGYIAAQNLGGSRPRALTSGLERWAVGRADIAYAPSAFLARHYAERRGIELAVVPPPVFREIEPQRELALELPKRFFIHFGQLTPVKGTPDVAAALPHVFAAIPDFAMLFVGRNYALDWPRWTKSLGAHRHQVVWLEPRPKPELYAMLARADAAVLPSRFDNLPNTVIESLLHGIPVIGTRGTSIDELVEHGEHGLLVAPRDTDALADAMISQWRGESGVRKGFTWSGPLCERTKPEAAVAALLALTDRG